MIYKKLFLILILFLLTLPIVFSTHIIQISDCDMGLQIIYPKTPYFLKGEDISLQFHVYNSTGYLVTNETTSCNIYIHNETGENLINEDLLFTDHRDFTVDINSTQTTITKELSYLVSCNNTNEAGFVSSTIKIKSRQEYESENITTQYLFTIFIILFFFLGLMLILPETHYILKLLLLGLSIWLLVLVPSIIFLGYSAQTLLYKNVLFSVRLIMFYWFIYFAYEILKFKGIIKQK